MLFLVVRALIAFGVLIVAGTGAVAAFFAPLQRTFFYFLEDAGNA